MASSCPDLKIKSLQVFRSEDEFDMEGIRVTLTNDASSLETLGVSLDSSLHTTIDLTGKSVKNIFMQKAVDFKAPVGFRLMIEKSLSEDVVTQIFSDEPCGIFEDIHYFKLEEG